MNSHLYSPGGELPPIRVKSMGKFMLLIAAIGFSAGNLFCLLVMGSV